MLSILDEITQKNDKYNNNITKISVLEEENDRIMAEICYDIKNSKNSILEEIKRNKDYLELLPKTASLLEGVENAISNDEVNSSSAKLVIEVLSEIENHKESIKSKEENIEDKNINLSGSRGLFNKFTQIVKESLEYDN